MSWRKLGRLFNPSAHPRGPKLITHAANPVPVWLSGNIYQIFFSGRDSDNRSSIGSVKIDIISREILQITSDPVFKHGQPGTFYADGVSLGNPYEVNGVRYILFMGWQNPLDSHWRGDIGRLRWHEDGSLSLDSPEPVLGVDATDPISLSYPWVLPMGKIGYRMWYGSTLAWDSGNGEMLHVINQATSRDGNSWQRNGLAIPYTLGVAQAFSRPAVVTSSRGGLEMWFSYRSGKGTTYRIGYASCEDNENWKCRLQESGIDVSNEGWDSEMICYPYVFDHEEKRFMLYNGNNFGKTGFGLAIKEET